MMHDPWTDKLSEYLDGELSGAERQALERHLAACPTCTAVLAELRQVVARARALPDRPPERELWRGIAARIRAPDAPGPAGAEPMRQVPRRQPPARPLPAHSQRFSLGQLAAAAVLAAAVSGGGAWWAAARPALAGIHSMPAAPAAQVSPAGTARPAAFSAEPRYDAAVADLERILAQRRASLDPKTVKVLERNLALIDRAIADARRALAADPGNAYLTTHLTNTMLWKLDLLREAARIATARS
ncbi:MAG TPA: anti-sigma factor [Gemmatimonadales bacterium]|nr:anti-sigma factor [Gemmatimonadales bacterium]